MRDSFTLALRRVIPILCVLSVATAALADPPPYPRLSVRNNTPYTITGKFGCSYHVNDANRSIKNTYIDVNLAPNGGYAERSLPDRISHNIDSHPAINGANPEFCKFWANGREVTWNQGYTCQTSNTQNFSVIDGKTMRLSLSKGHWNVSERDFCDITISWY